MRFTPRITKHRFIVPLFGQHKARYIGVSTMYTWQLAKIVQACERNGWHEPINMQLQLNLAYREEEGELILYCQDKGVGVSVPSPLRALFLAEARSALNGCFGLFHAGDPLPPAILMGLSLIHI